MWIEQIGLEVGFGIVRCQPAKTARRWCVARLENGISKRRGWQRVAGAKRLLGYVGRILRDLLHLFHDSHPSAALHVHLGGQKLDEVVTRHFTKAGERNPGQTGRK